MTSLEMSLPNRQTGESLHLARSFDEKFYHIFFKVLNCSNLEIGRGTQNNYKSSKDNTIDF